MKIFKYKHRRTRGQGEMPNINVVVIVVAETPGWPQTCYVAGVDLELLVILCPFPKCWD